MGSSLNYERLYAYRFKDVDQSARAAVWTEIAAYIYEVLGRPNIVLDPAAGRCEFINHVPSRERWACDIVGQSDFCAPDVKFSVGSILEMDVPQGHFDAIFLSNVLEHLSSPENIAQALQRCRWSLVEGGRIAVMGPNFRYCAHEYFDCADHVLALTHIAIEEQLYAAGFEIVASYPRLLPYSFRSRLPASSRLTRMYLRTPVLWRFLGKQFLVIGVR